MVTKTVQQNALKNVADIIVPAEMVNKVKAEQLHLPELPDEDGNIVPAGVFGEFGFLRRLDQPHVAGAQVCQQRRILGGALLQSNGPTRELALLAGHLDVVSPKGVVGLQCPYPLTGLGALG